MIVLDLNCDVGEATDAEGLAIEEQLMACASSVNIACGVHAGSPDLMRRTVRLAHAKGLAIGAHPGFRDPEGRGRREVPVKPAEVEALVTDQVAALAGVAALEGARLRHVKPHGALYNMAARDAALARSLARAVAAVDRRLLLVGLAGSPVIEAARQEGLVAVEEAFADRAYRSDGTLVPRTQPGAVLRDEAEIVTRVLRLVRQGTVDSVDGGLLTLRVQTLCLHADTPGADRLARRLRQALDSAGVHVTAVAAG
ncbi:MAG: 5-oxoprolinase subunit PxpA [Nitrospirales bacterium]